MADIDTDRDRQILILFALMERNRRQGRGLRLSCRELDVLASAFGPLMAEALTWGASSDGEADPQPDIRAALVGIAADWNCAALRQGTAGGNAPRRL